MGSQPMAKDERMRASGEMTKNAEPLGGQADSGEVDMVIDNSSVRGSTANVAVENAITSFQGQMRTIRPALEGPVGVKLQVD